MEVKVFDLDHKGNGMVRVDNKIVFIPKCIPGDIVDIDIVKSHKKYDDGRVTNIISCSDDRIDSLCPYYSVCGGCNISNLNYQKQLEYKKDKVKNIFKRYLKMIINPGIIGSDNRYEYRNKITYHCSNAKIGLVSIDNEIVNIDKCAIVSDKVNNLYENICKEDLSFVEKVIIKECDNGLILSIDGNINIDNIKDLCLFIVLNNEIVYKSDDGYISIGDILYKVSKNSFFQINSGNISRLYDVILKYGNFKKSDKVIDLYSGVGSISLYIANYVDSVLGIEIIPDAVMDAKDNASMNNITNVDFICGDVSLVIEDNLCCDVMIVDPPRIGLDSHTIDVLNNAKVDRLIYVSCDPMTLVRDLSKLDSYKVCDVTLVDMFPQTHHVETVVLLNRK